MEGTMTKAAFGRRPGAGCVLVMVAGLAAGGLSGVARAAAEATAPVAVQVPAQPAVPAVASVPAQTSPGVPQPAQPVVPAAVAAAKAVVSGTVPDEATRQAVLARAREAFGADRVVDQLGVGPLAAPPNWSGHLQALLASDALRQVHRGQLSVRGNVVEVQGDVASDALRQQVAADLSSRLNATYTVRNGLQVVAAVPTGQERIDAVLARRTIEFEPGNATLTAAGRQTLDALAPLLLQTAGRGFEITGHTDAQGARQANVALSAARADTVKAYLVGKGLAAERIATAGAGPDRPVAGNDTPEGRARNRRIELRVVS